MRPLLLGAGLLLLMAGCEGPTLPASDAGDIYDFRLQTTPPRVYRWPSGTTIRVYAASDAARATLLAQAVAQGAAEWNRHVLYGEYELVHVNAITDADVVVRWSDDPPPIDMDECPADFALAVTTFCLREDDATRLHVFPLLEPHAGAQGSVRFVVTVLGTQAALPENALRLVVHELGHVLGIGSHSPHAEDLMSTGVPPTARATPRDARTVRVLYHTMPHITP